MSCNLFERLHLKLNFYYYLQIFTWSFISLVEANKVGYFNGFIFWIWSVIFFLFINLKKIIFGNCFVTSACRYHPNNAFISKAPKALENQETIFWAEKKQFFLYFYFTPNFGFLNTVLFDKCWTHRWTNQQF